MGSIIIRKINKYVLLIQRAFSEKETDELLQYFMGLKWKYEEIEMYGKPVKMSQETLAFSEDGTHYTFNNKTFGGEKYSSQIKQIRAKIREILKRIQPKLEPRLNYVWMNRYNNGGEKLGWHQDNERGLSSIDPIVSVSFGSTRRFDLREIKYFNTTKGDKPRRNIPTEKLFLKHGDILIMLPPTQRYFKHQIPKETKITEPRINLTFRTID